MDIPYRTVAWFDVQGERVWDDVTSAAYVGRR
jgi:hypothetical protein